MHLLDSIQNNLFSIFLVLFVIGLLTRWGAEALASLIASIVEFTWTMRVRIANAKARAEQEYEEAHSDKE